MKKYLLLLLTGILTANCGQVNQEEEWINQHMRSMSVREKIGQMICGTAACDSYWSNAEYRSAIENLVQEQNVGTLFIHFGTTKESAELVNHLQSLADIPVFMWVLEKHNWDATQFPELMALGANGNPEDAFEAGYIVGTEIKALGSHYAWTVLDVNTNSGNPIINIRSFGDDPEAVRTIGGAYMRGLLESNLITAAGHFPGHGDTYLDSHLGLPVVDVTRERLEAVEFHPFRTLIERDILKCVVTSHISYPAVDKDEHIPATVSKKITTDLLQTDMGFTGLVWTDGMQMKGITDMFTLGESAIRAIEAGHDVMIFALRNISVIDSVAAAVENGRITEKRIDYSVRKILREKFRRGLHRSVQVDFKQAHQIVGSPDHKQAAQRIIEKSLTLVRNEGVLPIARAKLKELPMLFFPSEQAVGSTSLAKMYRHFTSPAMEKIASNFGNRYDVTLQLQERELKSMTEEAVQNKTVVVYALLNVAHTAEIERMAGFLEHLHEQNCRIVLVSLMNPYLVRHVPFVDAFVTGYGWDGCTAESSFRILTGELNPAGTLPVTIPELYKRGHGLQY